MREVFVLITFDVDPAPNLSEGVDHALEILRGPRIPGTFFFTARAADEEMINRTLAEGHEVGCHGLTHDESEELQKLGEAAQLTLLTEATSLLRNMANRPIVSFRSPRVKISGATLRILEGLGYTSDSSVCSQRLDFISSNLINLGWLTAPRAPYHPSDCSPYRRGSLKILEIPVSALLFPFISTALRVFGVAFMKLLFILLYWESRLTGKPIVYLVHPHEFIYSEKKTFHWRMLIPDRSWKIYGFPIRRWLSRRRLGPEVRRMNACLLAWMARKDVRFMTVNDYVRGDRSRSKTDASSFRPENGSRPSHS